MAKSTPTAIQATSATILNDDGDESDTKVKARDEYAGLAEWVVARALAWSSWRDSNYGKAWDEYERLWRGVYSQSESLRASERSQIVTPALSEAVENAAAELEEAIFGRGADYFDLQSPAQGVVAPEKPPGPPQPMAAAVGQAVGSPAAGPMGAPAPESGTIPPNSGMMQAPQGAYATKDPAAELDRVRAYLKEDLQHTDFAAEVVKAILYSAVFGSGFGEILLDDVVLQQPMLEGPMIVASTTKYTCAKLRAINPRNFAWDPNAETLEKGLGCAIIEMVSKHRIMESQKKGEYRSGVDLFEEADVDEAALDGDQQADGVSKYSLFRVKQTKYYGKVPKSLLDKTAKPRTTEDDEDSFIDSDNDEFVEAFVVVINDHIVAKAVRNPFSQQDRPVVHFPWDLVPGRLLGRGICEKGSAPQKILDAEVRGRLDSLALVMAPMMGMDVNRMPRGFKFKVVPGGSVLTNGKPSDVLEQFKFGALDPNHWQNAADIKGMVQQATGSIDGAALAANAGDARSGAMSMAMAPIIKRYKRTLVHFLDEFLMPALEKILWRNMQFNKDRYPAVPFKFRAASTMGIMQREYETQQMTTLLASMQPGTPEHRAILSGVVSNSSIPAREQIMKMIAGAEMRADAEAAAMQQAQQDPLAQQLKQVSAQLAVAKAQNEIAKLQAETNKLNAQTAQIQVDTQLAPAAIATKGLYNAPGAEQQQIFDNRLEAEKILLGHKKEDNKAADRASNERIVQDQLHTNVLTTAMKERNKHDIIRTTAEHAPQPGAA